MNRTFQPSLLASLTTQLWKGAAPNLINRPKTKGVTKSTENLIITPLMSIKIEAKVWTKKYFTADSVDKVDFFIRRKGIKANVFNSIPIQQKRIESEDRIIKILKMILNRNKNSLGEKNIAC